MKSKEPVKANGGIFTKITKFIKQIFNKKRTLLPEIHDVQNQRITESNNIEKPKSARKSKEEILQLYERFRNGEVDIFTLDTDLAENICVLLEEENKIKEKQLNIKMNEIAELDKKINALKNAI